MVKGPQLLNRKRFGADQVLKDLAEARGYGSQSGSAHAFRELRGGEATLDLAGQER